MWANVRKHFHRKKVNIYGYLCQSINTCLNHSWVPEGQTVLIADFDAEIPFRQKYGVTTRQTGVYFDAEGNHVRSQMGVLFPDILGFLEGDNVANSTVCSGDSANDC